MRSRRDPASRRIAVRSYPRRAVAVVPGEHVGRHHRGLHLGVERIHDRRRQAAGDRHREERAGHGVTVRQPEPHVRGSARRVHVQLVPQSPEEAEGLLAGRAHRADRHHERVDDHVVGRDAVVGGAFHDAPGDREPNVGILGDAGLVVRDRHDGSAVPGDEWQDPFHHLVLAGDRVHEGLALVHREPRFERLDDRGVDRQRDVGDRLHELHRPGEERRLVGERDPGVDVEHVGPAGDLGDGVRLDPAEVAGLHLLGEQLSPGGVDPLADHHERPIEPEDDLAGRRADQCLDHGVSIIRTARRSRRRRRGR